MSEKRTAMITGAAVGIGRATALHFAKQGMNLLLIDLDGAGLEKVAAECGGDVLTYTCSVAEESAVQCAVDAAIARFGAIDILVNNAAVWRCWDDFLHVSLDDWQRFLQINIMGTVIPTRAVLPKMLENHWGRIINVASVAGVYGNAMMTHYSATKGAVIAFTRALAKETTEHGVLVNAVSPGSVSPSDEDDITYTQPSDLSFAGRTGSDAENANLIAFLASDAASYISGQNIQIDGCRKKQ